MKKWLKAIATAGMGLFLMTNTAMAADLDDCLNSDHCAEITIHGASAQYKYWTSVIHDFLVDEGCSEDDIYVYKGDGSCVGASSEARDAGFGVCAGNFGVGTANSGAGTTGSGVTMNNGTDDVDNVTLVVKYSSYASIDGCRSVKGLNPEDVDPECDGLDDENYRRLQLSPFTYDLTGTEWSAGSTHQPNDADDAPLANCECEIIQLGCSDVNCEDLTSSSTGELLGPFNTAGENTVSKVVVGEDMTGYNLHQPVIVPFRFFANAWNDGTTDRGVPYDSINFTMGRLLFRGKVNNWNAFEPDLNGNGTVGETALYPDGDSLPVIQCMRHAGSGTHATVNGCVARGIAPVSELPLTNIAVKLGFAHASFFNKGSSDELRCVGGWSGLGVGPADGACRTTGVEGTHAPRYEVTAAMNSIYSAAGLTYVGGIGAIGYADADKLDSITTNTGELQQNGKYGCAKEMYFTGVEPIVDAVSNCRYECLWSPQHCYSRDYTGLKDTLLTDLIGFASEGDNMPSDVATYWIAGDDMCCCKDSAMDDKPTWCSGCP